MTASGPAGFTNQERERNPGKGDTENRRDRAEREHAESKRHIEEVEKAGTGTNVESDEMEEGEIYEDQHNQDGVRFVRDMINRSHA